MRVVVLAVRSSPGLLGLPAFIGLALGVVLLQGTGWTAEWRWAVDWAGAGVFLVGPLAAGMAAYQSQAAGRASGEAAIALRSPVRFFAFHAGGVFCWAALAHALVVLLVLVATWRAGTSGVPDLRPMALHCLFLAAHVGLGFVAGQLTETRLLAPIMTVLLLVVVIEASNGALPTMWVEVAGATMPLAGLAYRVDVVAAQSVAFLAALTLAAAVSRGVVRPRVRWAPFGTAVLALVLAGTWLSATEATRFTQVADQDVRRECHGSGPQVCLLEESASSGPAVQEVLASLHVAAGGPAGLPEVYVQVVSGETPGDARGFTLGPGAVVDGRAVADVLVQYVVWNRDCLRTDHAPPGRAVELLSDLAVVLLSRADPRRADPDRLLRLFDDLDRAEQDAWIASALAASDRCDFAAIPDWLEGA
jgi:hypothetical protein